MLRRFRREASEERKPSITSHIERLSELASSSALLIVIMTLGIIATTVACLPILLGLKFLSVFVPDSKDTDSSIAAGVAADADTPFTERLVTSLFGESSQSEKRYSRVWELK